MIKQLLSLLLSHWACFAQDRFSSNYAVPHATQRCVTNLLTTFGRPILTMILPSSNFKYSSYKLPIGIVNSVFNRQELHISHTIEKSLQTFVNLEKKKTKKKKTKEHKIQKHARKIISRINQKVCQGASSR